MSDVSIPADQMNAPKEHRAALHVAVLVPCYNEEAAIANVVRDFRTALPGATVYVYDNNSKDQTIARAREAGAVVRSETRQGKGNVVRRMFADIEADVYVLVDGDDTYDAAAAPALVHKLVDEGYDIVSGKRVATGEAAYRPGHVLGNRLLTGLTGADVRCEAGRSSDRLSRDVAALREILSLHGRRLRHRDRTHRPCGAPADADGRSRYALQGAARSAQSASSTPIATACASSSPSRAWCARNGRSSSLAACSRSSPRYRSFLGVPVITEYLQTGLVPRLPTAVLATGLMLLAFLSLVSGLILDTVTRGRWELKRLAYLAIPGPQDRELP